MICMLEFDQATEQQHQPAASSRMSPYYVGCTPSCRRSFPREHDLRMCTTLGTEEKRPVAMRSTNLGHATEDHTTLQMYYGIKRSTPGFALEIDTGMATKKERLPERPHDAQWSHGHGLMAF